MNSSSTEIKQIRIFGLIALVFFGTISVVGFYMDKPFPSYFFGFLSLLGIGFLILPKQLKPIYRGWLKIAHLIGRFFTTLMLTLAYYIVITPFGLVRRLFTGPILPVKPEETDSTYWVIRDEPSQAKERYIKRY